MLPGILVRVGNLIISTFAIIIIILRPPHSETRLEMLLDVLDAIKKTIQHNVVKHRLPDPRSAITMDMELSLCR